MITVAFTVSCKRPRYLRRAVESWARCRGPARFLFSLEPPPRSFGVGEFTQWAREGLRDVEVVVRPRHLGCNVNTYRALSDGFRESDFVVLAEEDIEVADDTLEYFTWAQAAYQSTPGTVAVCAHVKEAGDGGPADVLRAPWFSPLVWGTWRDRWEELLSPGWLEHPHAWDGHVRMTGAADLSRRCVFPARSRSRHFGERSTITPARADGTPNYFHLSALTSCFAWEYGQQDYREAQVTGAVLY